MSKRWQPLAMIDKHCFGCGSDNNHGLQMRFATDGEQLRSFLTLPPRFRGWSNLVHGGILSTILDETMGWTVICLTGKFMLTKSMQVNFKRPVKVGTEISVTGRIQSFSGKRGVVVAAEVTDRDDRICAFAEAEFTLFTREQFLRLNIMEREEIDRMLEAVKRVDADLRTSSL